MAYVLVQYMRIVFIFDLGFRIYMYMYILYMHVYDMKCVQL